MSDDDCDRAIAMLLRIRADVDAVKVELAGLSACVDRMLAMYRPMECVHA